MKIRKSGNVLNTPAEHLSRALMFFRKAKAMDNRIADFIDFIMQELQEVRDDYWDERKEISAKNTLNSLQMYKERKKIERQCRRKRRSLVKDKKKRLRAIEQAILDNETPQE